MKKAIQLLNFAAILDGVKAKCRLQLSEDYFQSLCRVEKKIDRVKTLQDYTKLFYNDMSIFGMPDLKNINSCKVLIKKIEKQQILTIGDILQVLLTFQNAAHIQLFYQKFSNMSSNKELLVDLLQPFTTQDKLVKMIECCINEREEVLDSASSALKNIREQIQGLETSVRTTLRDIMQKEQSKMAENYFTLRNYRYVLPIKVDYINSFRGILHDQSASGTTVYIEPQALVTINNRLQQLRNEENQEIQKIIQELSKNIFEYAEEFKQNVWGLARFDIYSAKSEYAVANEHISVGVSTKQIINLKGAKHPLLESGTVVENDVIIGSTYQLLMITGANTGGKSVFLKTIGLLSLMFQAGLYLPVDKNANNHLGVFDRIFIDIGDEQSMEQNLSTFSAHMKNMKVILTQATAKSLVLLDELGSGTDPQQGAALSISILDQLLIEQTLIVGTTHFNAVKEYITLHKNAENAAMSFDLETLKPTYHVRYGSYGASYAFDIARALKLPENIIARAESYAKEHSSNAQELLEVYEQRLQAVETRELTSKQLAYELEKRSEQIVRLEKEGEHRIEIERQKIFKKTEAKIQEKLIKVNSLLAELKDKDSIKHNEQAKIKGEINQLQSTDHFAKTVQMIDNNHKFAVGDTVLVPSLHANGTLLKEQNGKWLVKVGALTTSMPERNFQLIKTNKKTKQQPTIKKTMSHVPPQIDLRGLRVLDGIEALELYLANAASSHETIRIIHGHGTGSMREAVQDVLKRNKFVKSFRYGGEGEGGVGATIAEL